MAEGSQVKELANRVIKLTDGLYSPQVESEQFQTITHEFRILLDQFMEGLFVEHIKVTLEWLGYSLTSCTIHGPKTLT